MALVQYINEYGRLRKAVLYRPAVSEIEQVDAASAMYVSVPDANKVLVEFDGIIRKLQSLGVETIVLEPNNEPRTSNMIFLRDVAFTFRDQIILANMKYSLRQKEPGKFKRLLAATQKIDSNTFIDLDKAVTMEGADIFAINESLLYVYTGSRTSSKVVSELRDLFPDVEITTIEASISGVPQHILGGVHILNHKTATRRVQYCADTISGYDFIDFPEDKETGPGFALNIVTIAPNEILMPAHRPNTKAKLEAHGVICHEANVEEIHKMGGGLACMVLPLFRDN